MGIEMSFPKLNVNLLMFAQTACGVLAPLSYWGDSHWLLT